MLCEEKRKIVNRYRKQIKEGKKSYNYYYVVNNDHEGESEGNCEYERIGIKDLYAEVLEDLKGKNIGGISMTSLCKYIPLLGSHDSEGASDEKIDEKVNKPARKSRTDFGKKRIAAPNKLGLKIL